MNAVRPKLKTLSLEKIRWWLLAISGFVLIAFVVFMGLLRLVLPYLSDYKDDVQQYLTENLQREVSVKSIDADWHWLSPRLILQDVIIKGEKGKTILFRFDEASFEFGLFSNLVSLSFEPTTIYLNTGNIVLRRDKGGELSVQGMRLAASENKTLSLQTYAFLKRLDGKEFQLKTGRLHWLDQVHSEKKLEFNNVESKLKFSGDEIKINLDSKLPDDVGNTLALAANVEYSKDKLEVNYLNLKTESLNSEFFLRYFPAARINLDADIDADLKFSLAGNSIKTVTGNLKAQELLLKSSRNKDKVWRAENLKTRIALQRKKEDWSLSFIDFNMKYDQFQWKDVQLKSHLNLQKRSVKLKTDYFHIDAIASLVDYLPVNNDFKKVLGQHQPQGVFKQLAIEADDWNDLSSWQFAADFSDFGITFKTKGISVAGLTGKLSLKKNEGAVRLNSKEVMFDSPYFNKRVNFTSVSAEILLRADKNGYSITTGNIQSEVDGVELAGSVFVDIADEIFLDLNVSAERADANWLNAHQTDLFFGKKAVDWMQSSIKEANFKNISFRIKGDIYKLPFRNNEGVLAASFDFDGGLLKYQPDWPELKNVKGRFGLENDRINIDSASADIYTSSLSNTNVSINLISDSKAKITGDVDTDVQDLATFFKSSPLKKSYNALVKPVEATADVQAKLDLDIPFKKGNVNVAGSANISDGVLTVKKPRYNVDNISGDIFFENTLVNAKQLTGRFSGNKVKASIVSKAFRSNNVTTITAGFNAGLSELLPFGMDLSGMYNNKAAWNLVLGLPHKSTDDLENISVSLESNLKGLQINLPEPLNKHRTENTKLKVNIKNYADKSTLQLHCENKINLQMSWEEGFEAIKSDIKIQQNSQLTLDEGINLSAKVDKLNLKKWIATFKTLRSDNKSNSTKLPLNKLRLVANSVNYNNYGLTNVNLEGRNVNQNLNLAINSDEFNGNLLMSQDWSLDNPLSVNFSEFDLSAMEKVKQSSKSKASVSPVLIPPLKVTGRKFRYKDYYFDHVAMQTSRSSYGMSIHSVELKAPHLNVKTKGNWFVNKKDIHHSSFRVDLKSSNVGRILSSFNLSKSMKKGEGDAIVNWQWPAAPHEFDWKLVTGNIQLNLEEGEYVDIDPGAGRLLGMFSLSSLPKRFLLDFSDTFSEGFEFSTLSGQGNFLDGSLFTNNMKISGSSADVYFKGRVGLADKDYDQFMSVVPRISSGVSGWIAVLQGAAVGVTAYLGQKLLGVDEAAKNRYHITGSWKDPVIKKVGDDDKEPAQSEQEEESVDS